MVFLLTNLVIIFLDLNALSELNLVNVPLSRSKFRLVDNINYTLRKYRKS